MTAAPPVEIRNRLAIAGWVFMALWLGILGLLSWVLHRDGPHPGQPADLQYAVFGLFWLVGIPGTAYAWAQPCTRFAVDAGGGVTIARRSLFAREVETFPPGSIAAVAVREARNDEGDLIARTFVIAADGRERLADEGPVPAQQALAARLRAALGLLAESGPPA